MNGIIMNSKFLSVKEAEQLEKLYKEFDKQKNKGEPMHYQVLDKDYTISEKQYDIALEITAIETEATQKALNYYAERIEELILVIETEFKFLVILEAPQESYLEFAPFLGLLKQKDKAKHDSLMKGLENMLENRNALINSKLGQLIRKKNKVGAAIQDLNFSSLLQGTATNKLTKINSKKDKQAQRDSMLGVMKITREDFTVMLLDYAKHTGLRQSSHQLLDAFLEVYTNSGGHSPLVMLPLKKYMEMRGLKDEKSARQQVKEDLDTLENIKLTFTEKRRGQKGGDYFDLGVIQKSKGIVNGVIIAYIDSAFCSLLNGYKPMAYPNLLWRLNEKRNPNSFYFLRKIAELKHMNAGKTNEDIIAVLTLLKASPNIPSYEDIMKKGQHLTQQIIDPFERDMDALEEVLTWEYCHNSGAPLTDEDLREMNYEIFTKLYVKVYWRTYPDQSERLERKALAEKKYKKPVRKQK